MCNSAYLFKDCNVQGTVHTLSHLILQLLSDYLPQVSYPPRDTVCYNPSGLAQHEAQYAHWGMKEAIECSEQWE